jgi:hypothetical protein
MSENIVPRNAMTRAEYEAEKALQHGIGETHKSKFSVLDQIITEFQFKGQDIITLDGQGENPQPVECHQQVADYWVDVQNGFEFALTTTPHPTKANWVIVTEINMA